MEAVAAVGVASATIQFLDFSAKTLAACKEIRDSSTGSTKANEELTRSVKQLKAMQKTLQQSAHTLSTTYWFKVGKCSVEDRTMSRILSYLCNCPNRCSKNTLQRPDISTMLRWRSCYHAEKKEDCACCVLREEDPDHSDEPG
ncbi:hypothetical protein Q7P35_001387 [Cladosporium inversicolor]